MRARLVAAVTLTIALATRAGAAAADIADIVAMPDAYVGRTVTVVGTAENPVPLGPASVFDLRGLSVASRGSWDEPTAPRGGKAKRSRAGSD